MIKLTNTDIQLLSLLLEMAEEIFSNHIEKTIALKNIVTNETELEELKKRLNDYVENKDVLTIMGLIENHELCSYYRDYLEGNI